MKHSSKHLRLRALYFVLLGLFATVVTPASAQFQTCPTCPKISVEYRTNFSKVVSAIGKAYSSQDGEVLYDATAGIATTNLNQSGSEWQISGDDSYVVTQHPADQGAVSVGGLQFLLEGVQSYPINISTNEFLIYKMYAEYEAEMNGVTASGNDNSFSVVYTTYDESDIATGEVNINGTLSDGTFTLTRSSSYSKDSDASYVSYTLEESATPTESHLIEDSQVTEFIGGVAKHSKGGEHISIKCLPTTQYRLHFIGEAGKQYDLGVRQQEDPSRGTEPYPRNPTYSPQTTTDFRHADGSISAANPNNGTLKLPNGDDIYGPSGNPSGLVNVVGGASGGGTTGFDVVNVSSVSNPAYDSTAANPVMKGSAPSPISKQSFSTVGTGRVQHSPWYSPSNVGKQLKPLVGNGVCTFCGRGHDEATLTSVPIDLGFSPAGDSAGHLEISPLRLLAAARPVDGSSGPYDQIDDGVDEYCMLNDQTKRAGHAGVGMAVGKTPGSVLYHGANPWVQAQSTRTDILNEENLTTVTVYKPGTPSSANLLGQWRIEIQTNVNPHVVLFIRSAPNQLTLTNTYTYDTATRALCFIQPLASTVRETAIVGGIEEETTTKTNNLGIVTSKSKQRFQYISGVGRLLIESIEDPDGTALTTTRDYYTDTSEPGRVGRLKTIVTPTGGWTRYDYDEHGRMTRQVTGRNNTALTEPITETDALITENTYDDYDAPEPQTPRLTIVKIGTVPIYKRTALVTTNYTQYTKYAKPDGLSTDPENVTDTVWPCTEGAVWTLGKVRKIDYAGGQREVHFYEFPNSDVVVETILYGEPDPANVVNVIKGTRTMNVTRANGGILAKKVQDLETGVTLSSENYGNFDDEQRPRLVSYLDGTYAIMTYACCGLESVTRSDGSSVSYEYDEQKRLKFEIQTAGARTLTLAYTYNANDEVVNVSRKWNSEAAGNLTGLKLDLAGRVLKSTNQVLDLVESYSYAIDSGTGQETIATTYPNLSTKTETYNRDGSLAKVTGSAVTPARFTSGVESVDSVNRIFFQQISMNQSGSDSGYWTKRYVDSALQLIKSTSSANDPVQVRYAQGRVAKVTDADGRAYLRTYSPRGLPEYNVLDMQSSGILDTNLFLDGSNRVSKTESQVIANDADEDGPVYRVRAYVWPTEGTDASRLAAEVKVSIDGRRIWKTIFNNGVAAVSKSAVGFDSVTKKYYYTNTAPNGTKTVAVALHGLPLESKTFEANGTVLRYQTNGYDSRGRLTRVWDSRNGATIINYNNKDQVESVVAPSADGIVAGKTTSYIYNNFGQLYRVILPDNSCITNEYYANGLLAKRSGSQTYSVAYSYDDAGRQTTMTNWAAEPAGVQVTQWNFDPVSGRLQNLRYPDKTTGMPSAQGEDYQYTTAGRLKTKITARGIQTDYRYDGAGELTQISFKSNPTPSIQRTYDRLGQIIKIVHGDQTMTRSYNHAGQLLTEAYTSGPLAGKSVSHTYNAFLQCTSMTALDGATAITGMEYGYTRGHDTSTVHSRVQKVVGGPEDIVFDYAANSSLLESVKYGSGGTPWLNRTMQYDFLNRLKSIGTTSGDTHAYQFDSLNRRSRDTLGDGTHWEYAYDELGQLTGAVKFDAGGATSLNNVFNFTSDGIGNVLTAQASSTGGGEVFSFSPNRQNQITSLAHSPTTPLIGQVNPLATLTVLSAQTYPQVKVRQGSDFRVRLTTDISPTDRYLAFTNIAVLSGGTSPDIINTNVLNLFLPKDASETLVYDNDGNLTSDGRWDYTWDALNRLTKMQSKSTAPIETQHTLTFTYDAVGRRIKAQDGPAADRTFLYDGWDLVAEYSKRPLLLVPPTLKRTYGWLGKSGGLLWLKDHTTGLNHVPSYDGNGNVTRLVNYSDKTVSAEYEYTPYGELHRATGPMALSNPFRFSSEYYDDVSGLVYYGHRYYSPQTRRWLSRDPLGLDGGLNLYGFVGNDPINGRDNLGLFDLRTHVEIGIEALLAQKDKLGLSEAQFSGLMRGMVEGLMYPDLTLRVPTLENATSDQLLEHAKLINQCTQLKQYVPEKVKAAGEWVDNKVDALQRNTVDLLIPGYAKTREGLENWYSETPPVFWNLLEMQKDKSGTLAADLYQTHMGENSWQHFMASGEHSAQDIQSQVINGTLENYGRFSGDINNGNYHDAGFELGKSLHYLQDSYSASHVTRDANGNISDVHDYSKQSTPKHEQADCPGRDSDPYKNANNRSQDMIRDFLGGKMNSDRAKEFYPIAPDVRFGGPGNGFGLPENTIYPKDLWQDFWNKWGKKK